MSFPQLRRYASLAGALGSFALLLQLLLTIRLTLAQGGSVPGGVWIYLDYFTILTNALAATALLIAARGREGSVLTRAESVTAIAACMLIVGLVYNLLLRGLWQPTGWQRLADELLHVAMPLLFLAYWWLATARATLRWRGLLAWLLYPLGYLAYALARGMADGRYPYPFLDVAALGLPRVMANAAAVALAFVAVGAALAGVLRWRARR
jgi:phosphoglycerol transferase MdoB-like AlkP superfamily enzyme